MSSEIVFFLHDPDLDVSYDDVIPMVETVDIYLERSVEDLHQEEEFEDEEEDLDVRTEDYGNGLRKNEDTPEIKTEKPNDVAVVTNNEDKGSPKETAFEPLAPVQTKSQENLDLKKDIPKDEPAMTDGNKDIKKEIPKDEPLMTDGHEGLKEELAKEEPVMTDGNREMIREIINELLDEVENQEKLEISKPTDVIEIQEKKRNISKFSRVRKFVSRLTRRKKGKKSGVKVMGSNVHSTGSEVKVTESSGPQSDGNMVMTETKADDDVTGVSPDQQHTNEEADTRPQKCLSRRILNRMFCCLRVQ